MLNLCFGFFISAFVVASSAFAGDVAQFRGSAGNGVVPPQDIATSWSEDSNVVWKVKNPGAGWSQPVVWKDRLYVSGAVSEIDLRPANFADGLKSPQSMGVTLFAKPPDVEVEWKLFCLSLHDGQLLWDRTLSTGKPKLPIHPSNSWATETPVADERGVYVFFGATGTLTSVAHDGTVGWSKELGVFKTSSNFGTGSSLAIHEGLVFCQQLTEESARVTAFECSTGSEKWNHSRSKNLTSWSSPLVWRNAGRVELIISGGQQIESLDPTTGQQFWTLSNVKAATACTPCADRDQLYFGGSDPFSKGPLFAVRSGASGDISPEKENASFERCAWLQERQGPGMASPVSSGKFVYTTDSNILKCFSAASGERLYQTRLPSMELVAASPILVGELLLLVDENGKSCVVRTGPEFEVIGEGSLADTFWATPAVTDGNIILRGLDSIYCIRK
ncbi:MAG: PQQ-binding-like beta-propeller repeat protein [Planctomyces sp.]|nr:PQQ-binding-like beta-propeller repeat protein [Planctomyces sp.]